MIVLQMVLWQMARTHLQPLPFAMCTGALAAVLARWYGLTWWWLIIECGFLPALHLTSLLHLPAWVFLLAFLLMLGLYWSTYRTQVPLYLSGRKVWAAVAALLPGGPVRVIDIGSGLGGLVLHLAQHSPDASVSGIELAPLPWLISWMRARLRGSRAHFLRGDYLALDFSRFDVVFAYLSPAAMPALWQNAFLAMQPGALLLSYEFMIDGHPPDLTTQPIPAGPKLYGWYRR